MPRLRLAWAATYVVAVRQKPSATHCEGAWVASLGPCEDDLRMERFPEELTQSRSQRSFANSAGASGNGSYRQSWIIVSALTALFRAQHSENKKPSNSCKASAFAWYHKYFLSRRTVTRSSCLSFSR